MREATNTRLVLVVFTLGVLLSSCTGAAPAPASGGGPGGAGPQTLPGPQPSSTQGGAVVRPPASLVVADGPGWHGGLVDGPIPATGSCRYGNVAGLPLPDRSCTPGALDPRVTQASLPQTLCRRGGYTSSVRPPAQVTDAFKKLVRAAYSSPGDSSQDELDHLVPLGLGGASDARNLWPQPNVGDPHQFDQRASGGGNAKDGVESRLNRAVCAGEVSLAAAQEAIATNWYTAESVLGVKP